MYALHLNHKQVAKNIYSSVSQMPDYLLVIWMGEGLEEKVIAVMCFWILNQPVHRVNCPCMQYIYSPETQIANDLLK